MDEQNTKICSKCSTVNSADFTYCKNCGTQLYSQQVDTNYEPQAYIPPQYKQNPFYEKDGVDAKTMSAFVDKNADTYLSKFITMKINNKRISWHWPVFVLGILLGPVGIAFWFFYRKMYKQAFLFLILGTLLSFGNLWASFIHPFNAVIQAYGTEVFMSDAAISDALVLQIGQTFMQSVHPLNSVISIINTAIIILAPMFAFSIYEKFALKRIKAIKTRFEFDGSLSFYISKAGGTSTLAAVLAPIIYYIAIFILSFALTLFLVFSILQGVLI